MAGPGIIDNLLKAGAHSMDAYPAVVRNSFEELLSNPATLSIDDYTKWVDEASKVDGMTDNMVKALAGQADFVGRQINIATIFDTSFKNAINGSGAVTPASIRNDILVQLGRNDLSLNVDELAALDKGLNSQEFAAKIAAESTSDGAASSVKSAFSATTEASAKDADGFILTNMKRSFKIKTAAAVIAGGLFATEYATDGAVSSGVTSGLIDLGVVVKEMDPEVGQALIDFTLDGGVALYDLSGTVGRAKVNAAATALEESGRPGAEEEAMALRGAYLFATGLPGLAMKVQRADEADRVEVVISELESTMKLEREELGEFLKESPALVAAIEKITKVDLHESFPDLGVASKEEALQAQQFLARLEQLEKKSDVNSSQTLTDQFTNPMANLDLSGKMKEWSGNKVSSAFDFAQNNKESLNLGLLDTIMLAVVGWVSKGLLSNAFTASAGQSLQKHAMSMFGVDEKLADLQDNLGRATTDMASRLRVPGMDDEGAEYEAELAPV